MPFIKNAFVSQCIIQNAERNLGMMCLRHDK